MPDKKFSSPQNTPSKRGAGDKPKVAMPAKQPDKAPAKGTPASKS